MKKKHIGVIGYIILLLLATVLLMKMCLTTNQAMKSFALKADFIGEYSIGGGEWKSIDDHMNVSSFDGDMVMRGRFGEVAFTEISYYLNHIGVSISVNGEHVFESGRFSDEMPEMICGSYWGGWFHEELTEQDEIEIVLHNPHSYGNPDAYNEFLNSMYYGSNTIIVDKYYAETMPYKVVGIIMLVFSLVIFGITLGYYIQRLPSASLMLSMGIMVLCMGGYILFDMIDISFYSSLIVYNTCMRQFCIMFGTFELVNCLRKMFGGKLKKVASYVVSFSGVSAVLLLLLSIADVVFVYDIGMYYAVVQGLASLVMLYLSYRKLRCDETSDKVMIVSGMILLLVTMLELVNGRLNIWTGGIVVKWTFVAIMVFHLVRAVKVVAVNHRESVKTKELAEELRNSRIVLALSQIKTHFIFNVLTAISGMCEYDPKKADETLIRFSRYLRSNIEIMEEDKLESFTKSIEQLEDYISLEQVRFGDKIRFVKNLETTDFLLPPLVLQPIVENAIKHGLLPKKSGGVIEITTEKQGNSIIITISDDGIGFDTEECLFNSASDKRASDTKDDFEKSSIGLKNVRFRLEHMVNGTMEIKSSQGNGTVVTITIPVMENRR